MTVNSVEKLQISPERIEHNMWRRFGKLGQRKWTGAPKGDLYRSVEQQLRNTVPIAKNRWRQHTDFGYLVPFIEQAKQQIGYAESAGDLPIERARTWLYALVLQAPRAAQAQRQMDRHPHGYRNKNTRLYELIDFNDAFVATVLALPHELLPHFDINAKNLIDWFCKRVGAPSFSSQQYTAITHGLSREVAVYRAVAQEGFEVRMTTRTEDAFGIDMVITDTMTGLSVNIDTKTKSAFRYRLEELVREGRLNSDDLQLAEQRGYTSVYNGHGDQKKRVILWRIDEESYGPVVAYSLTAVERLIDELGHILLDFGDRAEEAN